MDPTAEQRRERAAFIRARREALKPARSGTRRRTSGLRREEVAESCGISTTWYSWIEQGRDISVSGHALARLAEALRLTPAERAYLFELSRKRDPASSAPESGDVPDELLAILDALDAPAYLLDRLWQARAWNLRARHLFSPWLAGTERSLLRFVFLDPAARTFICDWEERARRLLAEFRADIAPRTADPALRSLIDGLKQASPLFDALWKDQIVLGREGGLRKFNHPLDGAVSRIQTNLIPAGHPDHKIVILLDPAQSNSVGRKGDR